MAGGYDMSALRRRRLTPPRRGGGGRVSPHGGGRRARGVLTTLLPAPQRALALPALTRRLRCDRAGGSRRPLRLSMALASGLVEDVLDLLIISSPDIS
jgi:hypothetical protein